MEQQNFTYETQFLKHVKALLAKSHKKWLTFFLEVLHLLKHIVIIHCYQQLTNYQIILRIPNFEMDSLGGTKV